MRIVQLIMVAATVSLASGAPASAAEKPSLARAAGFRFVDATAESGLEPWVRGALNHAVAWGDLDGDNRLDLFLGNFADRPDQPRDGANGLFRQVEGGRFVPFPSPAVEVRGRCSGAVFADLDNDGDLDLYVSSNTLVTPSPKEPHHTPQVQGCALYRNDGGGRFTAVSQDCGACPATLFFCRDIGVLDYDNDGLLDLLVTQDQVVRRDGKTFGARMFRNLGKLTFEDVSARVNLPADAWGKGIAVADVNCDRRPDFFLCGPNRLFLSQSDATFQESETLRAILQNQTEEYTTGAVFNDLDRDGDPDLVTGPHDYHDPSHLHVYLNEGLKDGVPQFRDIARSLGLPLLPQKAPHPEIQDFDNDGNVDLYWSAWFSEGDQRAPFICRGRGVTCGVARFDLPSVADVKVFYNRAGSLLTEVPYHGVGMTYCVNGPAVDYDGDGDLDFFGGNWPPEGSHLFRNETRGGHWLEVSVVGTRMNRMGIGSQVRLYQPGKLGEPPALFGQQQISVNGGFSSGRPAMVHFGLGEAKECDVEVVLPSQAEPMVLRAIKADQRLIVREP